MSDQSVISIENLGKLYTLTHQVEGQRYIALRDVLATKLKAVVRLGGRKRGNTASKEDFWALKNVSFEIKRGEIVGMIGRNGAGKSTLLKILSRITEPSEGRVRIKGRVASLLEVGTGFHPELTGRENIFLNGAILGMSRAEIRRKFDEIVAFAEVEQFLDTPVKHYSSGMYVRLAFAVAAHLEPEILLVDEVLAVGDSQFQEKCLGRVSDVAKEGRTVIIVSHNMGSLASLCTKGVLLEKGCLRFNGDFAGALAKYNHTSAFDASDINLEAGSDHRRGDGAARICSVVIKNAEGKSTAQFGCGDQVTFEMTVRLAKRVAGLFVAIIVRTSSGLAVLHLTNNPAKKSQVLNPGEIVSITCTLPHCGLYPGTYIASFWLGRSHALEIDWVPDAIPFRVQQGQLADYGFDKSWQYGIYHCPSDWKIAEQEPEAIPAVAERQESPIWK